METGSRGTTIGNWNRTGTQNKKEKETAGTRTQKWKGRVFLGNGQCPVKKTTNKNQSKSIQGQIERKKERTKERKKVSIFAGEPGNQPH